MTTKLSKKQLLDLETIRFFIPNQCRKETDGDVDEFFDFSERGVEPKKNKKMGFSEYNDNPLFEGKRWRGIHMHELYEQGILDGSVPYYVLLGGQDEEIMPMVVVDFMKKEMFRGQDAETIESVYQEILEERTVV